MSQNSADDPPDYALIGEEGFDLSEINIEDVLKAAIEQPERFQQTISLCMNSEDFVPQLAHEVSLKNDLWEELQHGESLFPKLVECINQIEVKDEKNKQVKKKFQTLLKREIKHRNAISKCPHDAGTYYAAGMCKNCYHKKGRKKLASECKHVDRLMYAKGMCRSCYLSIYNRQKRESDPKRKMKKKFIEKSND